MKDLLYAGVNGYVVGIRVSDGAEVWRTSLIDGFFSSTHGEDVCVLEHEGQVFAGCNGHLFCLDGKHGKVLWHNEMPGLGHDDVSLSIAGKAVQSASKVEHNTTSVTHQD